MRPTCSHVRRVVGRKSSVPENRDRSQKTETGLGKLRPVSEKSRPMTFSRLPCVRVNTYLAETDDCQTETGLGKPRPVSTETGLGIQMDGRGATHTAAARQLPRAPPRLAVAAAPPEDKGDAAAPRFRHSAAPGPQTTPPRLAVAAAPPEGRGQRDRALPRRRRTPPRLAVVVAIALPENLAGEAWPRVVATVPPRDNRGGPAAPHHLHPPRRRTQGRAARRYFRSEPRVAWPRETRGGRRAVAVVPPQARGSAATPCPRCRATRDPWRTPPPLADDIVPPQVRGECGRVSPSPSGRARSAKDAAATPSCRRRFGGSTATPRPATPRRQSRAAAGPGGAQPRVAATVAPPEGQGGRGRASPPPSGRARAVAARESRGGRGRDSP